MEIKLTLKLEEVNVVMSALGNMPYVQVFELVQKLRNQAQDQIGELKVENNN